jgi:hypothetical protein
MESTGSPPAATQAAAGTPPATTRAPAPTQPPVQSEQASAPADGTYPDNQFSREQLIRHSRTLLGCEGFVCEVALRHAGGQDRFTAEEAKAAVKELLEAPANEEPDESDTEGEDA